MGQLPAAQCWVANHQVINGIQWQWRQVSKDTLCKCGQHVENDMKLTALPFLRFIYVYIFSRKFTKGHALMSLESAMTYPAVWETLTVSSR